MSFKRRLPSVWLVGGSSKLGLSIADRLEPAYNLVNLSRCQTKADSERFLNVSVDLVNISQVRATAKRLIDADIPRGIVFCQRYRPDPSGGDVDVLSGINTEIISTQNIIEEILDKKVEGKVSIVIISSVNGLLINVQLPFWYHWLKSSQAHLAKYYSVKNNDVEMNVNCIAAGTFLKSDIKSYSEKQQKFLRNLSQINQMKRICNVNDITGLVEYLISDQATVVNGQVITIDGGMTNILQETLVSGDHDTRKR